MSHSPPLRRWATAAVALALCTSLAACGDDGGSAAASTASDPAAASSASPASSGGAISVAHAFGTTELSAPPERIVTMGSLETDIVAALGFQPIAVSKFPFSESGLSPWVADRITGDPLIMETVAGGTAVPAIDNERLLALRPDVIIAVSYDALALNHDSLRQIAPVLGPTEANRLHVSWQDQTRQVAKVLAKEAEAEVLIASVEREVEGAVAANGVLNGRTFTLSLGVPDAIRVVQDPADQAIVLLGRFGLVYSQRASDLPSLGDNSGGASVSEENVGDIDADVIVVGYNSPAAKQHWESSSLFQRVPAVAQGRYLAVEPTHLTALRNPSPLAVPYALDHVIGPIAALAAQG